jgi:predicted TIM-barrel fold metal-dependent hydrolase
MPPITSEIIRAASVSLRSYHSRIRRAVYQYGPPDLAEKVPNGIEYELRRLHYDIAGTAYRPAIAALTSVVPTTQILFGSDNPFIPLSETADGLTKLGFSAGELQQIGRDNALALLPRLKTI